MACLGVALLASVEASAGEPPGRYDQATSVVMEGAMTPCEAASNARGLYAGVFGGGGVFAANSIVQSGTAFIDPPLNVRAAGDGKNHGAWLAGVNVGYECEGWSTGRDSGWAILPAFEFEGYYMGTTQTGVLDNPTPRLPDHQGQRELWAILPIWALAPWGWAGRTFLRGA
jgi:hypothetical protein